MTRPWAPGLLAVELTVAIMMLLVAADAGATHFRYGQLSWQRVSGNTVRFDLFAAFRRDGYSGTAPDGLPAIGDIITENIGATNLIFGDGGATGTLRFLVLNIDPANNWLYAAALQPATNVQGVTRTYAGPGPWTASIDSCCRISNSVNAPDAQYRVQTIIDLSDTNVSPTSTLPIIVQCRAQDACSFPVPAGDPDAQLLQYRLATVAESAIAPLAGLSVTATGQATYQASLVTGLYSAQIVVEKRDRLNPTNLLTSVAVDFLIQVQSGPVPPPPEFVAPTPTCGQTINLQVGQPIQFVVTAQTPNAGGNVTLNATGQPAGATFSPALPTAGVSSVSSQFTFTPTPAQAGQLFQMNIVATSSGRQTPCGYAIQVIAPNTVVRLNATRSGNRVRFQWLVSGSLCGTPTYQLFKRVGGGATMMLLSTAATAAQDVLTGPPGTLNEYRVDMVFPTACAATTQSNVVGVPY